MLGHFSTNRWACPFETVACLGRMSLHVTLARSRLARLMFVSRAATTSHMQCLGTWPKSQIKSAEGSTSTWISVTSIGQCMPMSTPCIAHDVWDWDGQRGNFNRSLDVLTASARPLQCSAWICAYHRPRLLQLWPVWAFQLEDLRPWSIHDGTIQLELPLQDTRKPWDRWRVFIAPLGQMRRVWAERMCCDRKCPLTWLLEGAQRRSPSQIIAIWAIAAICSAPGLHFCIACQGLKKATGNQTYSINCYGAILCFFWRSWRKLRVLETRRQANKTEPQKTKYSSNKPNSVGGWEINVGKQ